MMSILMKSLMVREITNSVYDYEEITNVEDGGKLWERLKEYGMRFKN